MDSLSFFHLSRTPDSAVPKDVLLAKTDLLWSLQPSKTHFIMQGDVLTDGSDCRSHQHWGGGEGESTRLRE